MNSLASVCQSCGMPFGGEIERGTEKDGTTNPDYCIECYKNGSFTEPNLTLQDMMEKDREQMKLEGFPEAMIAVNLSKLPTYKRWLQSK